MACEVVADPYALESVGLAELAGVTDGLCEIFHDLGEVCGDFFCGGGELVEFFCELDFFLRGFIGIEFFEDFLFWGKGFIAEGIGVIFFDRDGDAWVFDKEFAGIGPPFFEFGGADEAGEVEF